MTITELAKQLGVSKGSIYNKLKASGIELDSIREGGSNDLSNSGIATISSLFDKVSSVSDPEHTTEKTSVSNDTPVNADILIENAVLKERISALERENELLRANVDEWREQAKSSQRLLTGYVEKPSLFSRFFQRKKG